MCHKFLEIISFKFLCIKLQKGKLSRQLIQCDILCIFELLETIKCRYISQFLFIPCFSILTPMMPITYENMCSGIWKRKHLIMLKIWSGLHLIVSSLFFSWKEISLHKTDCQLNPTELSQFITDNLIWPFPLARL